LEVKLLYSRTIVGVWTDSIWMGPSESLPRVRDAALVIAVREIIGKAILLVGVAVRRASHDAFAHRTSEVMLQVKTYANIAVTMATDIAVGK
jgi:hypothetical protein